MKSQRRFSEVSVVLCLVTLSSQVLANPVDGSVRAGRARFDRSAPGTLSIQQDTDKLIINWREFSIAAGETTRFIQPSATSIALNRVVTANPSRLFGNLEANGKVYLINPNGILVGRGGAVNTRGFVASTLDVSDASFLSGAKLRLSGDSEASVVNEGSIRAIGGDVFLVGRTVENSGAVQAGTVGLGAGSEVVIMPTGRERLSVIAGNPTGGQSAKGVNNEGTIEAVSAELKAAGGNIYALAINNGGIIRATGVRHEGGRVFLSSEGGNVENSGTIVANNANSGGGFVSLAGGHNDSAPSTVINSGTIEARGESVGTKGGEVRMTGDYVGLFGASVIDVSGHSGGGRALIGGDYQGANAQVQNAQRTFVDRDAVIRADALGNGNGGKVIVWAGDVTRFSGTISARGGAAGGNGGTAEVSGHNSLVYRGHADLRAPLGTMGRLLLDPKFILIQTGGTDPVSSNDEFTEAPAATATIAPGDLVAALDSATVTLRANTDITFANDTDASANANVFDLILQAGRSIIFDNNVNLTLRGSFSATFNDSAADAANRAAGAAAFTMNSGSSVTAPGGISIQGGTLAADSTGATSVSANTGDIQIGDLSTAGLAAGASAAGNNGGIISILNNAAAGKNITIASGGSVNSSGSAGTGPGAFNGGNGGTITINASGTLSVRGINSTGGNASGAGTDGVGGAVSLTSGGDLTVVEVAGIDVNAGSGTVNVTAGASGAGSILDLNGDITGTGGITLTADRMTIDTSTASLDAGTGTIVFQPFNPNTLIDLGGADAAGSPNTLGLTAGELAQITAAGAITVGNSSAGNLTVSASVDFGAANLNVVSGGSIISTAGTLKTSGTVSATAGGSIGSLANPLSVNTDDLTAVSGGGVGNDIFITEANGLTALNLNAGLGNVNLKLTTGALTDSDPATDITANQATVLLSAGSAQDVGSLANPIRTTVNDLSVNTSAGDGDQFITEANGLTALNLNAGGGNVNLTLTLGGVTDSDGAADITAASATVLLSDALVQNFGSLANPINTSVGGLSVDTSAGGGSQFIAEANGLTALDLNAGVGNVNLTLTLGSVADGDGAVDITAASAAVTLSDGSAQDFGASGNHIGTSVDSLSVDTSAGGGDQFVTEANGLSSLNLNAGNGDVNLTVTLGSVLDTDGATDITADQATVTLLDATAQAFGTSGDEIATSVNSLTVDSSAGGGDQFIIEASGLTALNLDAGVGNVNLTVTAGGITDSDAGTDITAVNAVVTLSGAIGASGAGNAIQTSVDSLTVDSGSGDQFLREANGLTALDLTAGSGSVNLTLALGALTDSDGAADITAASATVILSDPAAQDFGSLANAINTSVGGLSVDTSAGGGSQFISEANGLTGLNLNAGAGDVNLTVLLGGVADTDGGTDITAVNAIIALNDATAQDFGASGNHIGTSVDSLNVDTSAGGGSQFITEANGLTALNLNAGLGDVNLTLTAGAVTDTENDTDAVADITAANAVVTLNGAFGAAGADNAIQTKVNSLSVDSGNGDQFIVEDNGLSALNLAAGAGNVNLTLTLGGITDTDGTADITAGTATVILSDPAAQAFGSLANPINTSVGGLSVSTAAGGGDQFITEANGLTGLDLNAGAGNVNLTLTLGAVADIDGTDDITADQATVTLSEAAVRNFGTLANPIGTSVNDLSVSTAAGGGSQFITEASGLTALNLNANGGNVNLTLTLGALTDTDAATDITAGNATVILSDLAAQAFGSLANPINTSVGGLSVDTSAGGGSQFITEANGLTGLNLNAGAGDVALTLTLGGVADSDGATDITADQATVLLSDATAQSFGSGANRIATSVNDLSVNTAAGGGDQFITEANGLTALNLDAGAGDVNLTLTLGGVTDTDAAVDITAGDAFVTLNDVVAQNFGVSAAQRIQTSVGTLSVDTSAGDGSQFIAEASALTGLNLNADGGSVDITVGGALTDTDAATDIHASGIDVFLTGPGGGAIGSSVNPIKFDAGAGTVTLTALGNGGGVHVELAQAGNLAITDSHLYLGNASVETLFNQNVASVFQARYANDLTIKVNGNINSTIVAGNFLRAPGVLTLNAVGGSIGAGIANPLAIDAGTLNASAATGLSFFDVNNVTLGSISTVSGAFFIKADNTLTFGSSTVINAGVGGTAILVADGVPGVSFVGNPTVTSRYLLYAKNAELTDPPVIVDSQGNNPTIGGLVADRIDSPINFNPATPDPFGDLLNHFVFSLKANPPTDPSLYIDIPVEVFQPVSIVFGDYDPTKFGEVGDLWMSSSELYEIERKAGNARKALPPQVNRTKYFPEGK